MEDVYLATKETTNILNLIVEQRHTMFYIHHLVF